MRIRNAAVAAIVIATWGAGSSHPDLARADGLTFVAAYPAPWLTAGGAMTTGLDGDVWVAGNQTIARVTQAGEMTTFSVRDNGLSISRGLDDSIWFSTSTRGIGRIARDLRVHYYSLPSGNSAFYVTLGPDGNIWFSDPNANSIGKVTRQGVVTEYADPDQSSPMAITSSGGFLWFIDQEETGSGRSTVDGNITEFTWGIPCSANGYIIASVARNVVSSGYCITVNQFNAILSIPNGEFPVRDAPYALSPTNARELWGLNGRGIFRFDLFNQRGKSMPLPNGYSGAVDILDARDGYVWVAVTGPPALLAFKEGTL